MESVSIPRRIVLAALCFGVQRRLVSVCWKDWIICLCNEYVHMFFLLSLFYFLLFQWPSRVACFTHLFCIFGFVLSSPDKSLALDTTYME